MAIPRCRLETTQEKKSAHMEFPEADIFLFRIINYLTLRLGI